MTPGNVQVVYLSPWMQCSSLFYYQFSVTTTKGLTTTTCGWLMGDFTYETELYNIAYRNFQGGKTSLCSTVLTIALFFDTSKQL